MSAKSKRRKKRKIMHLIRFWLIKTWFLLLTLSIWKQIHRRLITSYFQKEDQYVLQKILFTSLEGLNKKIVSFLENKYGNLKEIDGINYRRNFTWNENSIQPSHTKTLFFLLGDMIKKVLRELSDLLFLTRIQRSTALLRSFESIHLFKNLRTCFMSLEVLI